MTNRFILRMDQDDFTRSVEVTFEEEFLDNVLEQIDLFIRGCGYFPQGERLEYVSDFIESKLETPKYNYKDIDDDGRC